MARICANEPQSKERILPYIGGQELNKNPNQAADRYVIYFSDIQNEADICEWPALAQLVRSKVKPVRERLGDNANNVPLKRRWWAYQAHRPSFYQAAGQLRRVLRFHALARRLHSLSCRFRWSTLSNSLCLQSLIFFFRSDAVAFAPKLGLGVQLNAQR